MSLPLAALVQALRAVGLESSLTELREIVWLAGHITVSTDEDEQPPRAAAADKPAVKAATEADADAAAAEGQRRIEVPAQGADTAGRHAALYGSGGSGAAGSARARRVKLRGAPALAQSLAIARALRPLSRRRAGTTLELDERATADFIAETGVRAPVWRAARERWFDIVLAVEDVPTLAAWQPLVDELEALLARQGGFRSVTRLLLRGSVGASQGGVQARGPGGRLHSARSLHERHARRIVLAVSDCTSAAWQQGAMSAWLQTVAQALPVAVVQLLPPALWPHTVVGFAEFRAFSPRFAMPSASLVFQRPDWAEGEPGLVLPVLALEPAAVAAWARMVAAAGDAWASAALLPLPSLPSLPSLSGATDDALAVKVSATPPPNAAQRAAAFRATATPDAQQLAAYFSVVNPLTPPVMRVIHQALAPASGAAALAQVFLGGLLQPIGPQPPEVAADEVVYDYHPGLREMLEAGITRSEFVRVNLALHEHLQRASGTAFDFFALVEDRGGDVALPEAARPFAQTARAAARRFVGAGKGEGGVAPATAQAPAPPPALAQSLELAELEIIREGRGTLRFVHRSARGQLSLKHDFPDDVARLLSEALEHERDGIYAELADRLVPRSLGDSQAVTGGPPFIELVLDQSVELFPWELMLMRSRTSRQPLPAYIGLTRRPMNAKPRSARGQGALVVANPDPGGGFSSLPGARREADDVAQLLDSLFPSKVQALFDADVDDIVAAMQGLPAQPALRVLHIASHSVIEPRGDGSGSFESRLRIIVSPTRTLGLSDLLAMPQAPELVFLSCHHMAALAPPLLAHGARVVVAATGGTVDDQGTAAFAVAFYKALVQGLPLAAAVRDARQACLDQAPESDTWAKFQCWGDARWRLVDDVAAAAPTAVRAEPAQVSATQRVEAPTTIATATTVPIAPRPLPRSIGECEYLIYVSYAHADDVAWFGWVTHLRDELQRSLAALMRGVRLPPMHMSAAGGPVAGEVAAEMRRYIASSFALMIVVHDNYAQSEWCLRELEAFIDLYGLEAARERLYIVAMSEPAIKRVTYNETWRRLFGNDDQVWMPFFDPSDSGRPLEIYTGPGLVSPAFRVPFERLRQDLVSKLRSAKPQAQKPPAAAASPELAATSPTERAGPPAAPAPDPDGQSATIYIESNRQERTLWQPLGEALRRRWDELQTPTVPGGPAMQLRVRGLPVDQLAQFPPLTEADGVVLLWGQKTSSALLKNINEVEDKFLPGDEVALCAVAYLMPPQPDNGPVPAHGWQVLRFHVGKQDEPAIAEDEAEALDRFLKRVAERARRRPGKSSA